VASIEKRTRNGRTTYRVRYRDPSGRQRSKVFTLKRDADRWLTENEAAKLPGRAWVDPAAGRERFGEWAERWYGTTARCGRPPDATIGSCSTARCCRRSPTPGWPTWTRWRCGSGWPAWSVPACQPSGHARPIRSSPKSSTRRSTAASWPATSPPG
jgi:hypothetical protein